MPITTLPARLRMSLVPANAAKTTRIGEHGQEQSVCDSRDLADDYQGERASRLALAFPHSCARRRRPSVETPSSAAAIRVYSYFHATPVRYVADGFSLPF
jgi:hypothetical protein